jgi:hypothetical protein
MLDGVFTMQGQGMQTLRRDRPDLHRPIDCLQRVSRINSSIDLDGAGIERSVLGGDSASCRGELGSDGLVQRGASDCETRESRDSETGEDDLT